MPPKTAKTKKKNTPAPKAKTTTTTTTKEKKPPPWRSCAAKAYLYKLIDDGKIPCDSKVNDKEIYDKHCIDKEEFAAFPYDSLFKGRLERLQKQCAARANRSEEDEKAFMHDRKIFPKPTHDAHGEPMWQGSKAQDILRQYIFAGALDGEHRLKPKELYELREEFSAQCSLDSFRDRIYQERKAAKRRVWVEQKAAKKAEKIENNK